MAEQKDQQMDKQTCMKEFAKLGQKNPYSYQAKFFLNAFWKEHSKEAENVFKFTQEFIELDKKKEKGSCLDEFQSHRLLEKQGTVLTVVEMRKALKEIDVDTDNKMSLIEYCVWKYKVDIVVLMNRPQGVSKELEAAEEKIQQIQTDIKKIRKYKKKWDKKKVPDSGVQKIMYDNDMQILTSAEVWFFIFIYLISLHSQTIIVNIYICYLCYLQKTLEENLDFAMKKLNAAQNNKDLVAAGKTWWLQRELQEAKKYAAPKKKVVN